MLDRRSLRVVGGGEGGAGWKCVCVWCGVVGCARLTSSGLSRSIGSESSSSSAEGSEWKVGENGLPLSGMMSGESPGSSPPTSCPSPRVSPRLSAPPFGFFSFFSPGSPAFLRVRTGSTWTGGRRGGCIP